MTATQFVHSTTNHGNTSMKNVTVSINEHTHRQARIMTAAMCTSISALVRNYLNRLVSEPLQEIPVGEHASESSVERRLRLKRFFEEFDAKGRGVSEILPRDAIYKRNALR